MDFHMPANRRPRVLLLIPHLGGGGAERVTELLARGLSPEKYELHLGTITKASNHAESPPLAVSVHSLNAPRVRQSTLHLLRLIRRLQPDLILSGMFHLNFLVLLLRPFFPRKTRVVVRQNGAVSATLTSGLRFWYPGLFYRFLYRNADRVIAQSQSMAEELAEQLRLRPDRIVALPNPVDFEEVCKFSSTNRELLTGSEPHLLAVGRLSPEKGFDLLLQAMAMIRREIPDARLSMLGSGGEESALKAQCRALEIESAVNFAGHVAQPWSWFPDSTLFVLSSHHEGMPNAMLEAAAAGLPIVAVPSSGGVVELLHGQPGVWLASEISAEALAASLLSALHSLRPGERFMHAFVDQFRKDRAIKAYEELIDQTLHAQS